jgi:pimeloyl-ACP methyl ester carboxylesterase
MTTDSGKAGWGLRVLRWLGILLGVLFAGLVALWLAYRVPDRPVEELTARWAPPPSQFVPIDGLSVHLRDEGPRDDPAPIVLLHGTSSSLHTWQGWTDALRDQRRVVRFDMPGFGLTGPAPDGVYTIDRYVATVMRVVDELGIRHFVLVGNSLGGYVAWATALQHPERVTALVLVDSAGYPFRSQSAPLAFRIARTPVLGSLLGDVLPRSLVESSLRNVYGKPCRVTPQLVDQYFDLATRAGNRKALVTRFEQTQPGQLAERVPELNLPTLILWGGRDRLIPPDSGERFAREIRGSRLIVFPELGHVPHEEDPGQTVKPVLLFLDALQASQPAAPPGQG